MFAVLNKFLKKLGDEEGTEREDIVLEIELVDNTAPCEWFFGDKLLEPSDRWAIQSANAWGEGEQAEKEKDAELKARLQAESSIQETIDYSLKKTSFTG